MKQGEECRMCLEVLNEGCETLKKPEICALREKYITDPNMSAGDVTVELSVLVTPQERQALADAMVEKGLMIR